LPSGHVTVLTKLWVSFSRITSPLAGAGQHIRVGTESAPEGGFCAEYFRITFARFVKSYDISMCCLRILRGCAAM
jgi:hypothetical protein